MPKWLPKRNNYHPDEFVVTRDSEWARDIEKRLPSILADLRATKVQQPPLRIREGKCHGCHSSEFDASGKCVYCRQYQVKGVVK